MVERALAGPAVQQTPRDYENPAPIEASGFSSEMRSFWMRLSVPPVVLWWTLAWGRRGPGAEAAHGCLTRGPPEGAVDHGLEEADLTERGLSGRWPVSAPAESVLSLVTCIVLLKNLLPPMSKIIFF